MGLCIRWFKNYEILNYEEAYKTFGFRYYNDYLINFIDGDLTSHSYGNVDLVTDLFEKIIKKSFPRLPNEECIDSKDYKLNLIKPEDMSNYCDKILNGTEVDEIDMRDRFEWFKSLSDSGYYIAYD